MKFVNVRNLVLFLTVSYLAPSCINQKKVTRWLNENPGKAAEWCADEFPVKESVDSSYKIDSADYEQAYAEVWAYADSLLNELDNRVEAGHGGYVPVGSFPPPMSIDSLRLAISKQLRKSLKPCIDSVKVITRTIENIARVSALSHDLREKDKVISARDQTITEQAKKIKAKTKWVFFFWILVGLIAVYIYLKIRFKLPI